MTKYQLKDKPWPCFIIRSPCLRTISLPQLARCPGFAFAIYALSPRTCKVSAALKERQSDSRLWPLSRPPRRQESPPGWRRAMFPETRTDSACVFSGLSHASFPLRLLLKIADHCIVKLVFYCIPGNLALSPRAPLSSLRAPEKARAPSKRAQTPAPQAAGPKIT